MKVLFCIYQIDFADHIALAYLSAIAKKMGHSTHLCVLSDSKLQDVVSNIKPDVVAYSANIYGFEEMVAAHKLAKKNHNFVSIMGGPQPTFSPETFEFSDVDAYCVGEGEGAFSDFLKCIEHGDSFDNVLNLITRQKENPVRPLIRNLDDIPFPDRDLVISNSYLKDVSKKTFYATRGCPFKCKYCCNNYYHELYRGKGPIVRRFSVDRIIREIEYVKAHYKTNFIKFGDDIFALKADEWLEEFTEIYSKRIGIPFNCYLRFDMVNEKLLSLLKKAGCYSVHLSVDSTSEIVREKILGRHMKRVDITDKLRMIRSFGINTWVNFMLAAPESTLQNDLDSIMLGKKGKVTYSSYSTTVPLKGTALYDYCLAHNLIDPKTHKSDMIGCSQASTLSCFSHKEKDIRFNIYLLGAIIAKLPFPFDKFATQLIKVIPPNKFFRSMRQLYYKYSIENRIFKLHV
ncbi:MAG: B12-binding domain-containing radical SAM protein [Desulfobacterales bacterium]|nr:B12-binding domain-containing radical SAM protein [Desulfobacterales bacterium]